MPLRCTISLDVTSCLKGQPVQSLVPSHPVNLCPNLGIIAKKIKIKTNHCPQLLPIRDDHQTYRQRNVSGHSNHFASTLQPGLILGSSIHQGPDARSLKLTSLPPPTGPSPGPPTDGSHQQLRGPCGAWHCKASDIEKTT